MQYPRSGMCNREAPFVCIVCVILLVGACVDLQPCYACKGKPLPASAQRTLAGSKEGGPLSLLRVNSLVNRAHFVFVLGLPRSGTTLLASMIGMHSNVSSLQTGYRMDEGQYVQSLWPCPEAPGRWGLDPNMHLTEEHVSLNQVHHRVRLIQEWAPFWNLRKPYLLEKSPPDLMRSRLLQAYFPTASFIVITRHPAAQALAVSKWCSECTLESLVDNWIAAYDTARADSQALERVLWLSYESLVEQPSTELSRIRTFLQLPGEPMQGGIERSHVSTQPNRDYLARYASWCGSHVTECARLQSRTNSSLVRHGYAWDAPPEVFFDTNWLTQFMPGALLLLSVVAMLCLVPWCWRRSAVARDAKKPSLGSRFRP